jgi:hypothetical protein
VEWGDRDERGQLDGGRYPHGSEYRVEYIDHAHRLDSVAVRQ